MQFNRRHFLETLSVGGAVLMTDLNIAPKTIKAHQRDLVYSKQAFGRWV